MTITSGNDAAAPRAWSVRVDGADLACETVGSGPPVLCIQGVGVAGSGWRPQVGALARSYEVITFDNRGFGASTAGSAPLTIETMAGDVGAIADAAGLRRVHLVGHSMGGLIALHVAASRPELVGSLALLCTFADGAAPTKPTPRMIALGLRCRVGTRTMRRNGMLRLIMPPRYLRTANRERLARELGLLFGHDLADQPPVSSAQLSAMSKYSALARLPGLARLPALVVSAAHDPIAPPWMGRAIADGIAGARFVVFPEASHALPIQCPDEINGLLLEHLAAAESAAR